MSIIDELKDFGCQVDIYDPWVDPSEEKKHYAVEICPNPFENSTLYDAIILAVAHDQFKLLSEEDYQKLK